MFASLMSVLLLLEGISPILEADCSQSGNQRTATVSEKLLGEYVIEDDRTQSPLGVAKTVEFKVEGRVTRIDLEVSRSGPLSAGAHVQSLNPPRVRYHVDAFSKLRCVIRVYGN